MAREKEARGLGRKTREEIGKGNQTTARRFSKGRVQSQSGNQNVATTVK